MAKREGIDLGKLVNSAVEEGVETIVKKHPRFSGQEEFLFNYLDAKKINGYAEKIGKELRNYKDPKKAKKFIKEVYNNLAGYVASGELLNEEGKEIILRASWERKARGWGRGEARELLNGERYLDKVMGSFRDIYTLLKSGDYAQRMPELAEAVVSVYDMGFADAAVNVLYERGLMNNRKYKFLKKAIRERVRRGAEYTTQQIEKYIIPQRAAAVILGILGIAIILTSGNITGGVIGVLKSSLLGLISGVLFLAVGVFLWWKSKKH